MPKEDSSVAAELQPCSLVFKLEDDFDRPTACEPAAVKSSKPPQVDLEPHPCNTEGPSLSQSEEILQNNQLKKTEMQEVSLKSLSTLHYTIERFCI